MTSSDLLCSAEEVEEKDTLEDEPQFSVLMAAVQTSDLSSPRDVSALGPGEGWTMQRKVNAFY